MSSKDNKSLKKVFTTIGASNHVLEERQAEDFYATDPSAGEHLLQLLPDLDNIWECAVGDGALAKVFEQHHKLGRVSDLVDRGYRPSVVGNIFYGSDFLHLPTLTYGWNGDIVTNPPYSSSLDWVYKAIDLILPEHYVCLFLKTVFLEGKARRKLFEKFPPKYIFVSSSRIPCYKNGDMSTNVSSAISYSWFVWQKGSTSEPVVRWFN